jgi:hypothetical protein
LHLRTKDLAQLEVVKTVVATRQLEIPAQSKINSISSPTKFKMIFPTLAVVVGTLLAFGDASTDAEKFKAVRAKTLGEKCTQLNIFFYFPSLYAPDVFPFSVCFHIQLSLMRSRLRAS